MTDMPTIADLERFASSTPFDKSFMATAKELIAFMDTLPDYVPTKRDMVRAKIKALRRKFFLALFRALEWLADKARYAV